MNTPDGPFGLPELAACVHRFLGDNLPGRLPRCVIIYLAGGTDEPARVTIPAAPPCPRDCVPEAREEADPRRGDLPDCLTDILLTLREHHPRPLTKTRLLEEMARKGRTYAESTVARYLAVLMEDATIENPGAKARPPGYRLTAEGES